MPWKETKMLGERMNYALKSLQEGVNFSELCAAYGISRKTGYKWRERYKSQGAVGLYDPRPVQEGFPVNFPVATGRGGSKVTP